MNSNVDFTNVKVLGFDLDQTLYPKSHEIDEAIQTYLYECIAQRHGSSLDQARSLFINLYKSGEGLSGSKTMEALGFENGGELVQQALEVADIAPYLEPNPADLALLAHWRDYYSLDLLTGSNHANTCKKLGMLAISSSLFGVLITADDASKSSGEAYQLWLEAYPRYGSEQFLYIGDRFKTDYVVPKSYGIQSVIVNVDSPNSEYDCLQLPKLSGLADYLK